jgi:hypothetical protein
MTKTVAVCKSLVQNEPLDRVCMPRIIADALRVIFFLSTQPSLQSPESPDPVAACTPESNKILTSLCSPCSSDLFLLRERSVPLHPPPPRQTLIPRDEAAMRGKKAVMELKLTVPAQEAPVDKFLSVSLIPSPKNRPFLFLHFIP